MIRRIINRLRRFKVPGRPGDVVPHHPWPYSFVGMPRRAPQNSGRPEGRGASSPASPYSFIPAYTTSAAPNARSRRGTWCFISAGHVPSSAFANPPLIFPAGPRDVVLHLPLTLIPSSACTTSTAHISRSARGTSCFFSLQPLFLRRGAPRPAPHFPGRPEGRGASSPATPCFFVLRHHVRRLKHVSRHRMRPDTVKSRFFSINVY